MFGDVWREKEEWCWVLSKGIQYEDVRPHKNGLLRQAQWVYHRIREMDAILNSVKLLVFFLSHVGQCQKEKENVRRQGGNLRVV